MQVLVACETSGVVRDAFRRRGVNAWSCDLLPSDDNSPYHVQGDMFDVLVANQTTIKLLIAHPPCAFVYIYPLQTTNLVCRHVFMRFWIALEQTRPNACCEN